MRSSFIHNVKEAGYMKHRGAVMMHLLPDQHTQLWRGLHRDKFDDVSLILSFSYLSFIVINLVFVFNVLSLMS